MGLQASPPPFLFNPVTVARPPIPRFMKPRPAPKAPSTPRAAVVIPPPPIANQLPVLTPPGFVTEPLTADKPPVPDTEAPSETAVEPPSGPQSEAPESTEIPPPPIAETLPTPTPPKVVTTPVQVVEPPIKPSFLVVDQQSAGDAKTYDAARWDPIHFKPAIDTATSAQCLACHQEIIDRRPLKASPAGLDAATSKAWYQTLDTYFGEQDTFHRRHLVTDFAKAVMSLECNFCHLGNDPREESPANGTQADGDFTLRKMVDPEKTCLLCHGRFPVEFMEGLEGTWEELRVDLEDEETKNGCMTCHEEIFRTVRHQVTYLNTDAIESLARESSDVCFGCHGGRAWYQTTFPYPRHPWPDMPEETPEWATDRPTGSDPRYAINK